MEVQDPALGCVETSGGQPYYRNRNSTKQSECRSGAVGDASTLSGCSMLNENRKPPSRRLTISTSQYGDLIYLRKSLAARVFYCSIHSCRVYFVYAVVEG